VEMAFMSIKYSEMRCRYILQFSVVLIFLLIDLLRSDRIVDVVVNKMS
jgi:hypothetical protein